MSGDGLTLFSAQGAGAAGVGSVLVFSNDSDTWNFRAEITVTGGVDNGVDSEIPISTNNLGSMVAFGGETTYIYFGSGSSWAEDEQISITGAQTNRTNVSINYDGNMLVTSGYVGAGFVQNQVEIFTRAGGAWSLEKTYQTLGEYDSKFGYSLYAYPDGSGAIVGAYQDDPNLAVFDNPGRGTVTFINAEVL